MAASTPDRPRSGPVRPRCGCDCSPPTAPAPGRHLARVADFLARAAALAEAGSVKGDYPYAPRDRNDQPLYLYAEVHSAFDVVGRTPAEIAEIPRGSVTALIDAESVNVLWPDSRVEAWKAVNLARFDPPSA